MNTEKQRAFLCGLRDLMVRHEISSMYATDAGEIYVGGNNGVEFYSLGTVEEIEEEIKNLK